MTDRFNVYFFVLGLALGYVMGVANFASVVMQ